VSCLGGVGTRDARELRRCVPPLPHPRVSVVVATRRTGYYSYANLHTVCHSNHQPLTLVRGQSTRTTSSTLVSRHTRAVTCGVAAAAAAAAAGGDEAEAEGLARLDAEGGLVRGDCDSRLRPLLVSILHVSPYSRLSPVSRTPYAMCCSLSAWRVLLRWIRPMLLEPATRSYHRVSDSIVHWYSGMCRVVSRRVLGGSAAADPKKARWSVAELAAGGCWMDTRVIERRNQTLPATHTPPPSRRKGV
jgi:hypothetical protein